MNTEQAPLATNPILTTQHKLRVVYNLLGSANLGIVPSTEIAGQLTDFAQQRLGSHSYAYKCLKFLHGRALPRQDLLQRGMVEVNKAVLVEKQKEYSARKEKELDEHNQHLADESMREQVDKSLRHNAEFRAEMMDEIINEGLSHSAAQQYHDVDSLDEPQEILRPRSGQ